MPSALTITPDGYVMTCPHGRAIIIATPDGYAIRCHAPDGERLPNLEPASPIQSAPAAIGFAAQALGLI